MGEGGRRRLTQDLHTLDFEGFGHLLTGQLREGGAVVSLVPEFRKIDFSKKLSKTDEGLLMIILGTMEKNVPRRKRSLGYNDTRSELEGYFYMTYRCLPWRKRKHRRRRLPMSSYEFAAAMGYKGRSGRTCKKEDKSRYHNHRRCPTCAITFETADKLKQHIIRERQNEQNGWWFNPFAGRHRRRLSNAKHGETLSSKRRLMFGNRKIALTYEGLSGPCPNCLCNKTKRARKDCTWWTGGCWRCDCTPCDNCKTRTQNIYRRRLPMNSFGWAAAMGYKPKKPLGRCPNCVCTKTGLKKKDCAWHWCDCTPCDNCKARMKNRYRRRLPSSYIPSMDSDDIAYALYQASHETPASAPEDAEPTKPESSESSSESTVASGENPFSG